MKAISKTKQNKTKNPFPKVVQNVPFQCGMLYNTPGTRLGFEFPESSLAFLKPAFAYVFLCNSGQGMACGPNTHYSPIFHQQQSHLPFYRPRGHPFVPITPHSQRVGGERSKLDLNTHPGATPPGRNWTCKADIRTPSHHRPCR